MNDFKRESERFADVDKSALYKALLEMRACPNCRRDLLPVAYYEHVFACVECSESWFIPPKAEQGN